MYFYLRNCSFHRKKFNSGGSFLYLPCPFNFLNTSNADIITADVLFCWISHWCQLWVSIYWFSSSVWIVFSWFLVCLVIFYLLSDCEFHEFHPVKHWKFLSSYKYSWVLLHDAVKLLGNMLILQKLVSKLS